MIKSIKRIIKIPTTAELVVTKARLYYNPCSSGTDATDIKINGETINVDRYNNDGFHDFDIDLAKSKNHEIILEHIIPYGTQPSNTIIIKKLTIAYKYPYTQRDVAGTVKFVDSTPIIDYPSYVRKSKITSNTEKIYFQRVRYALKKIVKIICSVAPVDVTMSAQVLIDNFPVLIKQGNTDIYKKSELIFETQNDVLDINIINAELTIINIERAVIRGNLDANKFSPALANNPYQVFSHIPQKNLGIIKSVKLVVEYYGDSSNVTLRTSYKGSDNPDGIFLFVLSASNAKNQSKLTIIDDNYSDINPRSIKDIINNSIGQSVAPAFDPADKVSAVPLQIMQDIKLSSFDDGSLDIESIGDSTIVNEFIVPIKNWENLNNLELRIV